jgi:ADP-ribosylglycohydrolase
MSPVQQARFAGCLIGQCLGDALGFPVEKESAAVCARYIEECVKPGKMVANSRGPFAVGQYTDDSQLARELVISLVACRGFDPSDYAGRLARLFVEGRVVWGGSVVEEAARRIAAGVPWQQAGTPAPHASNGSAMRAAPLGLLFAHDVAALRAAAAQQSRITHQDVRSAAGAIALACATALALTESQIDPKAVSGKLAEWTRDHDPLLAEALREMPQWLRLAPAEVFLRVCQVGTRPARYDGWEGITPFVTHSVLWSLYAFLTYPESYREAVCLALAAGGDVDTTAAMTGALVGARVGLGGIPAAMAALVHDQGAWGYGQLVHLAGECSTIAASAMRVEDRGEMGKGEAEPATPADRGR